MLVFYNLKIRFNKGGIGGKISREQCDDLEKAMIRRDEWGAASARQKLYVNGIAKDVSVWQTGPDTCNVI